MRSRRVFPVGVTRGRRSGTRCTSRAGWSSAGCPSWCRACRDRSCSPRRPAGARRSTGPRGPGGSSSTARCGRPVLTRRLSCGSWQSVQPIIPSRIGWWDGRLSCDATPGWQLVHSCVVSFRVHQNGTLAATMPHARAGARGCGGCGSPNRASQRARARKWSSARWVDRPASWQARQSAFGGEADLGRLFAVRVEFARAVAGLALRVVVGRRRQALHLVVADLTLFGADLFGFGDFGGPRRCGGMGEVRGASISSHMRQKAPPYR